MFEQSLLTTKGTTRGPLFTVYSLIGECIAIALVMLIPVKLNLLPKTESRSMLMAPVPQTTPPPPATQTQIVDTVHKTSPRVPSIDVFRMPPRTVPTRIIMIDDVGDVPPPILGSIPCLQNAGCNGSMSGIPQVDLPQMPSPPQTSATKQKPTPGDKPIRVGGNVQQANILRQVVPVYPQMARSTHTEGTVRLEATIAKDGTIQNLRLINGPPLLVQAAMQAVEQWRYKPTLLNGEPVEVITAIDVNFSLSR